MRHEEVSLELGTGAYSKAEESAVLEVNQHFWKIWVIFHFSNFQAKTWYECKGATFW